MKKYALIGGWVISRYDGERHYIPANRLLRLYKLHTKDCVVFSSELHMRGHDMSKYICLYPRSDGNYESNAESFTDEQ